MSRTFVALLYSVVLGPGRRVLMADLRALAAELGFAGPRTLLATGNLILAAGARDAAEVEARLEPAFATRFGKRIDIVVRDAAAWPRLVAGCPFPDGDPARVAVRVTREPLTEAAVERLAGYLAPCERVAVVGGDLWVHLPDGFAPSRLPAAITPKRFGVGTFRNWNTVRKIAQALAEPGAPAP